MRRTPQQLVQGALRRSARYGRRAADELDRWAGAQQARNAARAGQLGDASSKPDQPLPSMQDITWFHSIDLGNGTVTPGNKSADTLAAEADSLNVPQDLSGRSVLDIGAWDGYFSFEAERRGAGRVVALDHYVWSTDLSAFENYHREAKAAGEVPRPPDEVVEVWDPVGLPGRKGFDYARRALHSKVEPVVGDFMTMDLDPLGTFDVVFFLGVLYHLKDPFLALRRLRQVTNPGGTAIVETAGVTLPGWSGDRLWLFLEATELDDDPSNWWAPTSTGLVAACRAAGFREARVILESREYTPPNPGYQLHHGRTTVHAYA